MSEVPVEPVRIDKFLWAVRIFKTRSLAADACRLGRVTIDDRPVKPSRDVKIGDIIRVLKDEVVRRYKVLQPLAFRVGAAKVREFAEDLTPPAALKAAGREIPRPFGIRPKGSGRPTKKDRRQMERFVPGIIGEH